MKKRRELDALIGNRTRRTTGGENHGELDSLSSLSSPDAETYFASSGQYLGVQPKRITRNTGCGCTVRRMIRICLPACFLSLVAACITACIGIVWMQVQLKTDMEKLASRLGKLETWQQDQPSTLKQMKVSLANTESELQLMKDGENGMKNLAEKLAVLSEKFESLPKDDAIGELKVKSNEVKQILDEVKSSMERMKSTIDGINVAQKSLTDSYDKLNEDVRSIKQDENDIQNVKQLTDLVSLSRKNTENSILQLNETLVQIADHLEKIETEVDVNSLTEDVMGKIQPEFSEIRQDIVSLKQDMQKENETLSLMGNDLHVLKQLQRSGNEVSDVQPENIRTPSDEDDVNKAEDEPRSTQQQSAALSDSKVEQPVASQASLIRATLANIQGKFNDIDANKDSVLSAEELDRFFGRSVFGTLRRYDLDQSGSLAMGEIIKATNSPNHERRHKRRNGDP